MHVFIPYSNFQIRKSQSGIHTGFTARDKSREPWKILVFDPGHQSSGGPGTEPGTGNRTVLEPELVEPAIKTEPDEPETIFGSIKYDFPIKT